jgi:hypothetical protein
MDQLYILAYAWLMGILLGIIFGIILHRRWYLWLARHDPSNQIQDPTFWQKATKP